VNDPGDPGSTKVHRIIDCERRATPPGATPATGPMAAPASADDLASPQILDWDFHQKLR